MKTIDKKHLGFTINGMHTWDDVINSLIDHSSADSVGEWGVWFDKETTEWDWDSNTKKMVAETVPCNCMRLIFELPADCPTHAVFEKWSGKLFGGWSPKKIKSLKEKEIIRDWFGKDGHFQVRIDLDKIADRVTDDTRARINRMMGH